jgi:2-polyprenyl-3-methyl-5-hydroxy-6-metoxy-1,4-benzoquinol methylase
METHPGKTQEEVWISQSGANGSTRSYKVNVRWGKPLDVLSLKRDLLSNWSAQISHVQSTRRVWYKSTQVEQVESCPICGSSTVESEFQVGIYGGRYHQCSNCTHCFIINRLTETARQGFYSTDPHFASTYTDPKVTRTRVEQVALPKAEWVIEQFRLRYGAPPTTLLDIGAGGGHFVHACRQRGIAAQGVELSESSRNFCRENFRIELKGDDFLENPHEFKGVEVLTFWNTMEHVAQPTALLKAAGQLLSGERSLLVVEVPRWNSLSTGIQQVFSDTVARHLDPFTHIHFFTDSSLATAFETNGFAPVAAWYFGMDAFELATQFLHRFSDNGISVKEKLGPWIPRLQEAIDQNRFCDAIVLAGVPMAGQPEGVGGQAT